MAFISQMALCDAAGQRCTRDPGPGLELVSPALQGGLPTPGPRKSLPCNFGLYPRCLTIMTLYLALMEIIDIFVLVGSQSG